MREGPFRVPRSTCLDLGREDEAEGQFTMQPCRDQVQCVWGLRAVQWAGSRSTQVGLADHSRVWSLSQWDRLENDRGVNDEETNR